MKNRHTRSTALSSVCVCVNSARDFTHSRSSSRPRTCRARPPPRPACARSSARARKAIAQKATLEHFAQARTTAFARWRVCVCARCRFYSYSATQNECAWFHSCNRASLLTADGSYMTYARWPHDSRNGAAKSLHALPSSVSSTDDHPRADGSLPLLPFSDVERPLAREERRWARGVGPLTTPGNCTMASSN